MPDTKPPTLRTAATTALTLLTNPDHDDYFDAANVDAAIAQLRETLKPVEGPAFGYANSRWQCPECGSLQIQTSRRAWFYESMSYESELADEDEGADADSHYCEACGECVNALDRDAGEVFQPATSEEGET